MYKRQVLYVDTEQSNYHCLTVMKRILRLAGLPDDRDNEHLEFLALRKYTPEQRIRIVEQAIYNTPDIDRKSTRLNSSHSGESRMPSSA